jgi:hypothetical protein
MLPPAGCHYAAPGMFTPLVNGFYSQLDTDVEWSASVLPLSMLFVCLFVGWWL